jgi:hypothetical protein
MASVAVNQYGGLLPRRANHRHKFSLAETLETGPEDRASAPGAMRGAGDTATATGWLAGAQYTKVYVDTELATVNPNVYAGGQYQWSNNWKVSGRFGVQSFGGAQLLRLTPFQSFTQPIMRLDVDRMDDNHNRLFGVTAEIAWVPKPSYQLTLRTPLYAVRH